MKKFVFVAALILVAGIAFGQTIKKGGMISIHEMTVTLKQDVTMDQYVNFLQDKWYPEINRLTKGVSFFGLKGDRGKNAGNLGIMVYCDSEETRNKYWPGDGSGSEEWSAIMQKMQPLMDELQKLGTYTSEFTDWKIF